MKKRFFIAIEPPEKTKERLFSLKIDLPAKWIPKDNIHLTLFFIDHLDDNLIKRIRSVIKVGIENIKKFDLEVDGFTYAPLGSHPPKMIWAAIADSEPLQDLRKMIRESLGAEISEFIPHITLARINTWKFKQLDEEEIPDLPEESFSFEVNSICLMESKIINGRIKYQLIERFKLK